MFHLAKHFETFLSDFILIDLDQVKDIIAAAIERHGGNKSEIARKLHISSQLLGQYEAGRQKPKPDFYVKWKKTFGEDLQNETFVSFETKHYSASEGSKIVVDSGLIWSMMREANEERIKALEKHNEFLQRLIETNLDLTAKDIQTVMLSQTAHDDVIMKALDRLEKRPEGTLAGESDRLENEMKGRLEKGQHSDKKEAAGNASKG